MPVDTAAQAIAVGIVANSAMTAAMALVLGTREFARRAGGALTAMVLLLVGVLVVLR